MLKIRGLNRAVFQEVGVSRWLLATSLLLGSLVAAMLWPAIGWAVTLKDLRFVSVSGGVRAELMLDSAADYRVFTLANPLRVVVDLENTSAPRSPRLSINNGAVLGVRSARKPDGLRVVFDLAKAMEVSAAMKPPGKGKYHRLVINLGTKAGNSLSSVAVAAATGNADVPLKLGLPSERQRQHFSLRTAPKSSAANRSATVQPAKVNAPLRVAKATPVAASTSSRASRASKRAKPVAEPAPEPKLRDFVVAVDAGHGGKDPGARGRRGTLEKRVVLAIAKQLKKDLDAVPGVRAVLIRSNDSYVDLRGRMHRARKQRADVFVSIHADAFRKASAHGASVFVLSRKGATSESARWLAKQENAPFLAGGVVLVDKDDDLRNALLDMSRSASHEAGFGVANAVLARLGKVTRLHAGRVERAGFLVLKSPDIPSILVETGFLSNPAEERKLRDRKHQRKLARAIRDGLLAYFTSNPPAGTLLAERKHTIKRGDTLSAIAHTYSVSLRRLRKINNIKGDMLRVGQVIRIPAAATDGGGA